MRLGELRVGGERLLERPPRRRLLALGEPSEAEVVGGLGMAGGERESRLEAPGGGREPLAPQLEQAKVVVDLGAAGSEVQRQPIVALRSLAEALVRKRVGEVEVRRGRAWRERQRALEMRHRLGRAALGREQVAEVDLGISERGLERQRPAVARPRLAGPPLRLQHQAKIVVGLGQVVVERQRLALAGLGAVELAERTMRLAEVAVERRLAGPLPDRLGDQRARLARPPDLQCYDTQEMQRVGLAGGAAQDRAVALLGRLQPAGVMLPARRRQRRGEVEGRGRHGSAAAVRRPVGMAGHLELRRLRTPTTPDAPPARSPPPGSSPRVKVLLPQHRGKRSGAPAPRAGRQAERTREKT